MNHNEHEPLRLDTIFHLLFPDSRTVVRNGQHKVEKNIKFQVAEKKGVSFRAGPVNVSLETFAIQNEFYAALDHKVSRVHCFYLKVWSPVSKNWLHS